ncbi:MAG: RNA-binding S4 domain-containing protein [Rhodopirellula sp.]|nr:RNA-binding S4 domain-containing protein [Rhodopirellula sp.]
MIQHDSTCQQSLAWQSGHELEIALTEDAENPELADAELSPPERDHAAGRPLQLDQFLKLCGVVETGGQAKQLIQGGKVMLNGAVETRRRKKLSIHDVIEVSDAILPVAEFFTAE